MIENYIPPKTISELIERYKNGERYFVECDLYDEVHDLRNLNLEGINLSKSFLLADFRQANLRCANFYQANVKTCDFRGADLANATFEDSAIDSALFEGAILENTNFENAGFYGCLLKKGEIPD
ncbi:MAG: pentapeptide repeat-containing protein [Acidobacteriota bacterium]|nr:pentapeptide repeat-containing protein [Acidobacteriota bacterium]